jgi:xanthine dehydrogenase accessory factor
VDSREDQFPSDIPAHTRRIISEYPADEVMTAPANTCFVIMTHNHQLDQDLCEAVLKRDDFRFCGLIGSMIKRRKFEHRLRAKGISESKLDTLKCPIGVSGISGKEPAVIAVSVTAQLLALN